VQSRGPDGMIDSDERVMATRPVVNAADDGARELGERYWAEVRRASLGFVRLRATRDGSELQLHPLRAGLLRFGPAEVYAGADGVACRFPIRGGLLARREGGALLLSQSGGSVPELRAALTGFVPRLGLRPGYPRWTGTLYDQLQRRIHVAISRRFFRSLIEGARP
jgi:hypothetical protein